MTSPHEQPAFSADPEGAPATSHAARPSGRGATWAFGILAGLVVAGGVAYGVDLALTQGHIPRGVTVAGEKIGGLSHQDARARIAQVAEEKNTSPVRLHSGEMETTFVPQEIGLTVDADATVAAAGSQPLNPWTRLRQAFKTSEIDLESHVAEEVYHPAVERLAGELSRPPADGVVGVDAAGVTVTEPITGQEVAPAAVDQPVRSQWLDPRGVEVAGTPIPPAVGKDAVEEAQRAADNALATPVVVNGSDGATATIPHERLGEVLTFEAQDGRIVPLVDKDAAIAILRPQLADTEIPMKDATITFTSSGRDITPSQDGVSINWDKTLEGFEERLVADGNQAQLEKAHTFNAAYEPEPALFTTAAATAATFDEELSSFSTSGFSGPSGVNIQRVAAMVDGAIVAPGQTFSLNGYTGPRGTAQGFVESGIILNGHADKAVGGGISQFATTLYNAAYFAGMEDVAHTPHSYYISRYPAGREATVFEGAIDLQFKNTGSYPVLIRTNFGGGQISVSFRGVKEVQVESIPGPRTNPTQPRPIRLTGSNCVPSGGAPGFTTSDTRVIRNLAGKELSRNTTVTTYDPAPIVSCG